MSSTFQSETVGSKLRLRCAFYGSVAMNVARAASIEAQLHTCQEYADSKGWDLLPDHIHGDEGVSGADFTNRVGLRALQAATQQHPRLLDCVLVEETGHLGRTQVDVLNFTKLMEFYGVRVVFVSQRLDSSDEKFALFMNAYKIMDEMFIDSLRQKVLRGQKARVLQGFPVGPVPYGYRKMLVHGATDSARAVTVGLKLEVAEEQASIVRRIFRQFVDGQGIGAICRQLNAENITSPRSVHSGEFSAAWSKSAIGRILRNPIFRGEIVWNVSRRIRHPLSGKLRKEFNPPNEHVRVAVDHLRIVDDDLWSKAAERLKQLKDKRGARKLAS